MNGRTETDRQTTDGRTGGRMADKLGKTMTKRILWEEIRRRRTDTQTDGWMDRRTGGRIGGWVDTWAYG